MRAVILFFLVSCTPTKSPQTNPGTENQLVGQDKLMPVVLTFRENIPDSIEKLTRHYFSESPLKIISATEMEDLAGPSILKFSDAMRYSTKQTPEERTEEAEKAMYTVGTIVSIDFEFTDSTTNKFLLKWRSIPAPIRTSQFEKIPQNTVDTSLQTGVQWPASLKKSVEFIVQRVTSN